MSRRPAAVRRARQESLRRMREGPLASRQVANSPSDQDDVVLLLRVDRFHLQRDRLADEIAELRQRLRFLVEKEIDNRLCGEDPELARVELLRLAQDFTQYLVADGLSRLQLAAALAGRTTLAQHVRQRFARSLARHFDEAELRETVDGEPRPVAFQRAIELGEHGGAMIGVLHVDEVDDDDSAEVAQPQLASDDLRRFEGGLEDRVVEAACADEAAGVDVDRRHGLRMIDDQVASRLKVDAPRQRLLDLVLDAVQIEERAFAR